MILQELLQFILGSEIAGLFTKLTHHIAANRGLTFKILRNDTVVSNQRERLRDDLSGITWIR